MWERVWLKACCFAVLVGCRGADAASFEGEVAAGGTATSAGRDVGDPGDDDTQRGGAPTVGATGDDAESSAGQAAQDEPASSCAAQEVTLAEIHAGRVRSKLAVAVPGLVASSQKFLVSEAKSGSCLWGAFTAAQSQHGAGTGLLLVSFGAPHREGEACQPTSDALPDDLKPGDLVAAQGVLDSFVPTACDGVAPSLQLRVDMACPLQRTGSGPAPEPAVIDVALADRLAQGGDASLMREWGGALVTLEAVSAQQDPDDGDAVFPFGVVRLAETRLEVRSRLYYFDLSEGGPRAATKAPHYPYPTTFPSITGVLLLDYCSWVLAPRSRCEDVPLGADCVAQATGP